METNQTQPAPKAYIPVDTDLVDNLEHYALDRIRVTVRYRETDGAEYEVRGLIEDVYTRDHAEFMRIEGDRVLRLDQIINVTVHLAPSTPANETLG